MEHAWQRHRGWRLRKHQTLREVILPSPSQIGKVINITPRRDFGHRGLCVRQAIVVARMNDETPFVPRGAVAFFAAMMVFYVAVWALLAAIMVARG